MRKTKRITEALEFIFCACLGAAFLLSSAKSAEIVKNSLIFTASTVIPALFPFMVVSKLISSSSITNRLTAALGKPAHKFFGLSCDSLTAVILGFISGFPIGALTVCESYGKGKLSKNEAERSLALAHNTGPSFPIGLAGAVLWNSKAFGGVLYVSQIVTWVIAAKLYKSDAVAENGYSDAVDGNCRKSFARVFTDAVTSSALTCVNIAAFASFMQLCSALLVSLLPKMTYSAVAVISALFEFSDGCVKAASVGGAVGCAVTGFAIGFGGLSALMQGAAPALSQGLSVKPLVTVKLFQGVLSAVFASLYYIFFGAESSAVAPTAAISYNGTIIDGILVSMLALFLIVKMCSKHGKTS